MRSSRALPDFTKWLTSVDQPVRHRVLARIVRAESGNLGDHKMFGAVGEMRIDFGPGYRIYFTLRGQELIILLCGGSKKTQVRDIAAAKVLQADLSE